MERESAELKRGGLLAELWVWSRVNPLSRPRVHARSRTVYQPKGNQKALLAELGAYPPLRLAEPLWVEITCLFRPEYKHHVTAAMRCYGDVDNIAKAVLDALVANHILKDDIYCMNLLISKKLAGEDACCIKIYQAQTPKENA